MTCVDQCSSIRLGLFSHRRHEACWFALNMRLLLRRGLVCRPPGLARGCMALAQGGAYVVKRGWLALEIGFAVGALAPTLSYVAPPECSSTSPSLLSLPSPRTAVSRRISRRPQQARLHCAKLRHNSFFLQFCRKIYSSSWVAALNLMNRWGTPAGSRSPSIFSQFLSSSLPSAAIFISQF